MTFTRFHLALLATLLTARAGIAQTVQPSIFSLSPSSIATGSGALTLNVLGANFQDRASVVWNGTPLPTTFVSASQLNAQVPASLTNTPGFAIITVINPGGSQSNGASLTITSSPVNISTSTLPAGSVGAPYAASLTATGGSPPYTWSTTSGLPSGLTLSSGGAIAGTPAASGTFTVEVRVTDSQQGAATRSFSLVIAGPVLSITTSSALPAARVGQAYTQNLAATGGTLPYTWSAGTGAAIPAGLSIAPTGVITGTPATAGTFSFAVRVADANGLAATQTFTLTVNAVPLTITTVPPLFNGTVGAAYAQTFTATGGTPPYRWSVISGDTGGLTLDTASGVLQGTPQNGGTLTFTVQVADSANARASQVFSVTVAAPTLSILTGASLPAGAVGVSYSQQFSVVGGTQPYTWSLTSGFVLGLSFDVNRATLSGTPSTPGTFTFTLQVRDSAGASATRTFTVAINPAPLTITTGTQLPDGALGTRYSFQMSAAGGVPPYTWNAAGLPDGLTIDPGSGTISGTPGAAGRISFAVSVTDSARVPAVSRQHILNVTLPPVPSINISGLPSTAGAAQQFSLQIALSAPFPAALTGQAILTFSPEVGGGDGTIQFSTGGTTANFTIPAGSTDPSFTAPFAIQTGTVAGTIGISLRLNAGGLDVTPSPAPAVSAHIDQAAPVIKSATFTRGANSLSIQIVGYSTAREVTQASFTFSAASGQTLQPAASQIAIAVDTLFGNWFQNSANNAYGSQFVFTQPFSIQGDVNAVTPQTVTLTNRRGTVTVPVTQ